MSESSERDRELGMHRKITRRDFLDGVARTVGVLALSGSAAEALAGCGKKAQPLRTPGLVGYPPGLEGWQGQTDASSAVPHMLRDGSFWGNAGSPQATGETYDLVVVGGGISGLAAAYFYGKQNADARILVLDNKDDFGGHAMRNEFHSAGAGGRLLVGYGGTESIYAPDCWSRTSSDLLVDIGVEWKRFYKYFHGSFWKDLYTLYFFSKESWGRDCAVVKGAGMSLAEFLKQTPMAEQAKRDLVTITQHPKDWLAGLSQAEKKQKLSEITYAQYLSDVVKVHPDVVKYLLNSTSDDWAFGIDALAAIDAWADGDQPGFAALGLNDARPYKDNASKWDWNTEVPYIFHFPDGGAGVARLLVRKLIPGALPGDSMESEVLAQLDYAKLDLPDNRVRIRLGSPVVKVRNVGETARATGVEVTYVQNGRLKTVKAAGAVMACWYSMVPYIVDGLPEIQQRAALFMTRSPLLYADVLLRDRRAFQNLGIAELRAVSPDALWPASWLDYPVSMDGYEYPMDLDQPGLLHMTAAPTEFGLSPREGGRVGRQKLNAMTFADIERNLRDLLARSLGGGGFDPARDIEAITVNRWAHGYSIGYAWPWDKAFYPSGPLPGEAASRPFGRITFAGTDRSSHAYMNYAMDAARSAVDEQLNRA